MMPNHLEPLQFSKALAFIHVEAADMIPVVSSLSRKLQTSRERSGALRLWSALPRSLLGAGAQGSAGGGIKPIDLILEAIAPHGDVLDPHTFAVLDEVRGALPFHAEVFAGIDYEIMPGDGQCALFCPLVRVAQISAQQFNDYWLNVHADFGRRDPNSRYRQLHASPHRTSALVAASGFGAATFDGVAQAYFTDPDELRAKLSSPEIAMEAYEDERRFIDHERSAFLPFERLI
jgi:hypothetical protein